MGEIIEVNFKKATQAKTSVDSMKQPDMISTINIKTIEMLCDVDINSRRIKGLEVIKLIETLIEPPDLVG